MRITASLLLLLVPGLAMAKVDVRHTGQETTYHFAVDGVQFTPVTIAGHDFRAAALEGVQGYEGVVYKEGEPEVPVIRVLVQGNADVKTGPGTYAALTAGPALKPAQPSRVKLPGQTEKLVLNTAAYARRSLVQPAYTIEPAGSIRGVPQSLVTLYPMSYAPATGAYTLTRTFDVTVHQVQAQDAAGGKEIFAFVVGAAYKDSPSLAKYKQLKTDLGYEVQQIDVTATDTPETVRAALKKLYARTDAKLRYALIIGKDKDVPAHTSTNISGITDHYYRAIDTDDYEADINGPDIGVGRVSVTTEDQLAAVLAKYTRYTTGVFTSETWLNGLSFLATDDRYEVAEATHNYVVDTYASARGYLGDFPAANQAGGDKLYAITNHATTANVLASVGEGRTIIDYSGHGSNTSWAGPQVEESDVLSLKDPNALPFVIGNACITGDFRVDTSFAETWERHPNGAITYWGSMDSTYWDEDDILERAMFDGIYRDGKVTFAEITTNAQTQLWAHYGGAGKSKYYWETYTTFGDPSLPLRTTRSRQLKVSGPAELPVGIGNAQFTVSDQNGPAAGVRVAVTSATGDFRVAAVTGADGKAAFDIAAAARAQGRLTVTVLGQNAPLTQASLAIIPADNPYLSLAGVAVNGRTADGVYLGEDGTLSFSVTNLGQKPTTGATLTIESIDGPATVTAGSTRIPALASQAAYQVGGKDLQVRIASDAASGAPVTLTLKWVTDEGQTAMVPLTFRVLRAALSVPSIDYGSPGADGGIHPADTGELYVSVTNTGNEAITTGTVTGTPGACVTTVAGTATISNLAPGATARLADPLAITIDPKCKNGDQALLTLTGTYTSVAATVMLTAPVKLTAGVVSQVVQEVPSLNVAIPDNGPAVTQAVTIAKTGVVTAIGVHVKLTHTYVGDLQIKLIAPDGTEVLLRDREGGSAHDLDLTYGLGGTALPALSALVGKSATGDWKVSVQDMAASDTGTLTYVGLTLKGYLN